MMKSNGVVSLTRREAVTRAHVASLDKGNFYGLGRGGRKPAANRPYDSKGRVDCSGAVCWFLGFDRLQNDTDTGDMGDTIRPDGTFPQHEVWYATDGIYDDARGVAGDHVNWFELVPKGEDPLPGDLLVYPDYRVYGHTYQGHVEMVTKILPGFVRGRSDWWTYVESTGATPSNRLNYGNVIASRAAKAFRARKLADGQTVGGTFVRYRNFKPDALSAVVALPKPSSNPPMVARAPLPTDPMLMTLANLFPRQPRVTARRPLFSRERVAALAN